MSDSVTVKGSMSDILQSMGRGFGGADCSACAGTRERLRLAVDPDATLPPLAARDVRRPSRWITLDGLGVEEETLRSKIGRHSSGDSGGDRRSMSDANVD
ncbi:hypothetical protein K523DRAFT_274591 [Schizophyllum commune Tattone D]|nr:hypothetical protein K523DRAFT_274591 [Schizophyllum commune Tattone D]